MSKKNSKNNVLSIKKTIYNKDGEIIKEITIPRNDITESLFSSPCNNEAEKKGSGKINRKSLPRLDPKFLEKISEESAEKERVAFEDAVVEALKENNQIKITNAKQSEVNSILEDNPLSKYGDTKEYKKAKAEFYYETIYQLIDLRMKILKVWRRFCFCFYVFF